MTSSPSSISQRGNRASVPARATRPSSRARAAPRQKWGPKPKEMCRSIVRRTSNRSGSRNSRGSRFALPFSIRIFDSAGIVTPCSVTGRVTHRPLTGDGASYRSSSSIALGISDGSAARLSPWSGFPARVTAAQLSSRATASMPAPLTSTMTDRISSSGTRRPNERVEVPGGERADRVLELGHPPGGERPADDLAQDGVLGRVHEDHHLERGRGVELLQLDPVRRAEGRGVVVGVPHVLEAADRPETVLVVPVQRLLLAHPPPHRMRVRVDRVVV